MIIELKIIGAKDKKIRQIINIFHAGKSINGWEIIDLNLRLIDSYIEFHEFNPNKYIVEIKAKK